MPEIKNTFTQGKMNKDLDERIIPNGQYRDAMNVQVSTSEGSDIGTVQNILGNIRSENVIDVNNSKCVGSISNEKTNKLYWFIKSNSVDAILEFSEDSGVASVLIDTKAGTVDAVLKFPDSIITGINIIDDLLLWTDGVNEPKRINIERCKLGNLALTSLSNANHTKLVVGGDIVSDNSGSEVDIREEHITSIKKNPLRPLSVFINEADEAEKSPLFEKIFPRFSYRYRYEDGEYSTFAPFTDVVFLSKYAVNSHDIDYDSSDAYGTKEPYNIGMRNMIQSVDLQDFVSPNMPEDVVQIDLLYKQENSNVIYVLEVIKNNSQVWNNAGSNINSIYKGSFNVFSENIYAATPENQLLRPWDNIPKTALAQEVTGNRVVYGNYTQGYNMEVDPTVSSAYNERDFSNDEKVNGGLPSVKSQRDYQIGVVYGDKYGRETPVFTNEGASLNVPWGTSIIPKASKKLQLRASLAEGQHPSWAEYYKFFVKETSGEYYNLVMDALYSPTVEDLSEDHHAWLSFASSDRNKVSEEDYIILKKRVGVDTQILVENKYKVLDVKNEAPDAIKYKYLKLGEVGNTTGLLNDSTDGIFYNSDFRPEEGKDFFHIHKTNWEATGLTKANGMPLTENDDITIATKFDDLFVSWTKDDGATIEKTEKYKVSSIRISSGNVYIIQLEKPISHEDSLVITDQSASNTTADLDANTIFTVERKLLKNLEAFSGRFFVKILGKGIVATALQDALALQTTYNIIGSQNMYWHADVSTTGAFDPDAGLINNSDYDVTLLDNTDETSTITTGTPTTSAPITNTEAGWDNLLAAVIAAGNNRFFIDNMYIAASQPSDELFARHSGQGWYGGEPSPVGDIIYSVQTSLGQDNWGAGGAVTSTLPTGYIDIFNGSPHHTPHPTGMAFPQNSDIKPQNSTNTTSGDNMVNGIPGVITTSDDHTSATGIRRWKESIHNNNLIANVYPTQNNKPVIHLSFLAPGEDLHNNTWSNFTSNERLATSLQGIWGGGIFTKADGSAFSSFGVGTANFTKGIPMEHTGTTSGTLPGEQPVGDVIPYYPAQNNSLGINEKIAGYHIDYKDLHEKQWKPEFSGGSLSPSIDAFITKLKTPNQKFRLNDDTTGAIYTIGRVEEKRIYNHTPWRRMYKSDGTGGVVATGDSVEEAAVAWANTRTSGNQLGETLERNEFKKRIFEFGKANNRRVCYIIHLADAVFPATSALNPTDTSTNSEFNSLDFSRIDFITESFNLSEGDISEKPAIWETEPKDNVDLDIYYEASQAYPTIVTEESIELFAPAGSTVSFPEDTRPFNGLDGSGNVQTITGPVKVGNWSGVANSTSLELVLSEGVNQYYDNNGYGESIYYTGIKIRFTRNDGSYTTATVSDAGTVTGSGFVKILIIDFDSTETGLSWYNCFSFGNGIESDRIRDDFNAMTLTNGVRANSTLDRPYTEERRKNGLIYSGLYNSTNGVNSLNQFIAAEKITKDLNPTYGSIQKLFSRRISLIAFCEDRVIAITANKNALYNADGNPQLVATNAVLGDANPFVGDYGISKNPESFAQDSYRAYFTDKQRGAVLRLSMDGLTPISDAGMHDYFRDNLKTAGKLIGTYDDYKKDYNLTLADFLPENVISNSEFEEGSGSSAEVYNTTEYIINGNFANGSNTVNPSAPTNVAENSDLDSETTITNWPIIPEGYVVTEVPYEAPVPATTTLGAAAVFGGSKSNYSGVWNYGGGANPFTGAVGTPLVANMIVTTPGSSNTTTIGNIYWKNLSSHWADQKLLWNRTDDWLGFDLSQLPHTNNIGDSVPTSTNSDGNSVASLYQGKDNTFYNGEEIRIRFLIKQAGISSSFSNTPTMSVGLYDGSVNSGNLIPSTKLQIITTGALPYENLKNTVNAQFTGSTNNASDHWTPGYTSSNPYTFPQLNEGAYEERWFYVYYKVCDGTTNEGVVIQDLRVILDVDDDTQALATDNFAIERVYQLQTPKEVDILVGSTTPEVLHVPPVPPSDEPAWAEVEHTAVNDWSASNSNLVLNDFAIDKYGANTGSGTVTGTAPNTYITGTPNSTTTYNQYADGLYSEDGHLEITSGAAHLTQDLSAATGTDQELIDGNWYEVRLIGVAGSGTITVSNVLDDTSLSGSTLNGHLGPVSGGGGNTSASIIFDKPSLNPTYWTENSIPNDTWIARFKYSDSNAGDSSLLKLYFYSFIGTINGIEFADISDKSTGGGADDWTLAGNDTIYHYYSPRKVLRWHNSAIRWGYDSNNDGFVDVGGDEQPAYQKTANWALPVTADGYELRFQTSLFPTGVDASGDLEYNSGSLRGYVTGPFEAVDTGHTYGFEFDGVEQGGYYKVTGNLDGATNPTIERTLSDYVTPASSTGTITASIKDFPGPGHADKVLFRPTDGSFFKGKLSFASLKDITNYFTSTSVDGWTFVGFDPNTENYITWDDTNENILFTNAPVGTSIQQALPNTNFVDGATIEFSFDADITSGKISGYFYNEFGEGFAFGPVTGSDGYSETHVMGAVLADDGITSIPGTTTLLAAQLGVAETDILRETLVTYVDTELVNGTIDNFALYRVYPEFIPSTITYSEDVKGWVSFKSFMPESGLSLSKEYYTMRDGRLWQHHTNETRNEFYNTSPIVESTITAVLNAEPSLIKIYNTLNYEGTQSKVNLHTTKDVLDADGNTVTLSNAEIYNLNAKDGWYVESIITDKQSGSIQEFIEKEGKWFNYIKGTGMTDTTLPSTADLSFQGLGVVFNTTTP